MSSGKEIIYKLKSPLKVGDNVVADQVRFKHPKVKHLRALNGSTNNEVDGLIAFISKLTDLDTTLIDDLEPEDFAEIQEIATNFLARFRKKS